MSMTFDEACGIKNPHGITHDEKYDRYLAHIGEDAVRKYLPVPTPELVKAYITDKHFNNIPLSKWEKAAGYPGQPNRQGEQPPVSSGAFTRLLTSHGVTLFSSSECVCLLKRAAERLVLQTLVNAYEITNLECWAVFEHWSADPDRHSKHNIFDLDCIALFRTEQDAIEFEMKNPDHRVRKLIHDTRSKTKKQEESDDA